MKTSENALMIYTNSIQYGFKTNAEKKAIREFNELTMRLPWLIRHQQSQLSYEAAVEALRELPAMSVEKHGFSFTLHQKCINPMLVYSTTCSVSNASQASPCDACEYLLDEFVKSTQ